MGQELRSKSRFMGARDVTKTRECRVCYCREVSKVIGILACG